MDTIVIANFEYYSCSVRKIQILGSLTYPCQQWALLGEFEANDTRAEQIFELRQSMWARYLKLRFLTHHGSQHYWSLTTVRAYGQTHVDKFNSDNKRLQDAVNAAIAAHAWMRGVICASRRYFCRLHLCPGYCVAKFYTWTARIAETRTYFVNFPTASFDI